MFCEKYLKYLNFKKCVCGKYLKYLIFKECFCEKYLKYNEVIFY